MELLRNHSHLRGHDDESRPRLDAQLAPQLHGGVVDDGVGHACSLGGGAARRALRAADRAAREVRLVGALRQTFVRRSDNGPYRSTAWRIDSVSFSLSNLAEWTPTWRNRGWTAAAAPLS